MLYRATAYLTNDDGMEWSHSIGAFPRHQDAMREGLRYMSRPHAKGVRCLRFRIDAEAL